ncbi:hypothetical protein ZHAS_00010646 [Anopheles sinensis]|uniref:Uncharacterized protein n=1 Tax=Anopheles sinensis TaxID=74873 RepID=A0A084VY46_ANOSI|nr:hypothetical protein ZHAS_00010646 [Anopheles sinensis]
MDAGRRCVPEFPKSSGPVWRNKTTAKKELMATGNDLEWRQRLRWLVSAV